MEGHLALLESTDCRTLISPVESKVDHILSKRNLRHFNVEALKTLLRHDFSEHYEYNKTFEEATRDPFIVIHTSGSTGLPKPITLYHGGMAAVDSQHLISPLGAFDAIVKFPEGPIRVFTTMPPFHVGRSSSLKDICSVSNKTDQVVGSVYPTELTSRSFF